MNYKHSKETDLMNVTHAGWREASIWIIGLAIDFFLILRESSFFFSNTCEVRQTDYLIEICPTKNPQAFIFKFKWISQNHCIPIPILPLFNAKQQKTFVEMLVSCHEPMATQHTSSHLIRYNRKIWQTVKIMTKVTRLHCNTHTQKRRHAKQLRFRSPKMHLKKC